jgi:hypothetical protein
MYPFLCHDPSCPSLLAQDALFATLSSKGCVLLSSMPCASASIGNHSFTRTHAMDVHLSNFQKNATITYQALGMSGSSSASSPSGTLSATQNSYES